MPPSPPAPPAAIGALALLTGETNGFAIDATTAGGTVAVIDTGTPANNLSNVPIASSNLVQSGTSPKYVLWNDGTIHTIAAGQVAQAWDAALSKFGILVEPAATNLALQSDDFTNASWTKSNMTTAFTSSGPDGGTNNASRLTASAGNATALQAITSGSSSRITSMWVKRITGSGNIDLTQDNGSTWQTMTVTASWTRVNLTAATLTNPTVGIRIVTNTDAIDVWGFQHETGIVATSTIPTLGSTVTRAVDDVTATFSAIPTLGTEYTTLVYWKQFDVVTLFGGLYAINDGSASNRSDLRVPHVVTADAFISQGGANQAQLAIGTPSANTAYKSAVAVKANDFSGVFNGAAAVTDSSGIIPTGLTTYQIGNKDGNTSNPFNGFIYQLTQFYRRVSDADMQTKTT